MEKRPYNFSAGPGIMPVSVLERAASELQDYRGTGMSVMEMSHRSSAYLDIFEDTKSRLRRVLSVPDTHEVLFMQGGASTQFSAVALNLMGDNALADYALTGHFSTLAAKEAARYGKVNTSADMSAESYRRIPRQHELKFTEGASYFHYCSNNTIYGTAWDYVPETSSILICDMSSEIMSKPIDISKYGLIYAGAQKNMGPAGVTVVIVDKSILGRQMGITPDMLNYKKMSDKDSMPNTPPCYSIYVLGLVLEWAEAEGGVTEMARRKTLRADIVYKALEENGGFIVPAEPASRSEMNLCFTTGNPDEDARFIKGAVERGMLNLKGHRSTGGMRASMYNAMPLEGASHLADYIKGFEVEKHV